jgi:N-acetylglutamate synthase
LTGSGAEAPTSPCGPCPASTTSTAGSRPCPGRPAISGPRTDPPAPLIERLAANAWPAANVQLLDGWLLRHTPGIARRRSNSALPPSGEALAGRGEILNEVERFYADRGQPAVVQVSPAELHGRLDRRLAARGYRRQAPTVVLATPIDRVPSAPPADPGLAVSVAGTATPGWLAAWAAIEGRPDAAATRLVLARIGPPAGFLAATRDGEVVGVGLVVVERGWAGLFCMATRPEDRRRGVASAVARRAAGWAAGRGARQLYLQVEEDNQPALRLYGRLGFRPSHRYHYRVTPAAAPSARPGPGG